MLNIAEKFSNKWFFVKLSEVYMSFKFYSNIMEYFHSLYINNIIKVLSFIILLIISFQNCYTQVCNCPTTTGWQQTTFSTSFMRGVINCRIDITYCYFCGDNSLHREIYFCKADLKSYSTNPEDPNYCIWPDGLDIGRQEFWDVVYQHILDDMYDKCPITIPFCQDSSAPAMFRRFTEIKRSSCLRSVFNPVLMQNEIRSCETETECVIEYDVCIDLETAVFVKLGSYEIGESNCPHKIVGIPGLNNTPNANYTEGTCFNPCD